MACAPGRLQGSMLSPLPAPERDSDIDLDKPEPQRLPLSDLSCDMSCNPHGASQWPAGAGWAGPCVHTTQGLLSSKLCPTQNGTFNEQIIGR